jgi:hypothetical protein
MVLIKIAKKNVNYYKDAVNGLQLTILRHPLVSFRCFSLKKIFLALTIHQKKSSKIFSRNHKSFEI